MPSATFAPPKYHQALTDLRDQVKNGVLRPGDPLPTQKEMRSLYGISPVTADKVLRILSDEGLAVREQGRGSFVAEPKRKPGTGLIGFIGHDSYLHSQSIYVSDIAEGIRCSMARAERQILLLDSDTAQGLSKVDGVIVCSPRLSESILQAIPAEMPCVSLLATLEGKCSVIADDSGGAYQAVQFLIEKGHRRIACLMEEHALLANLRLQGYREALLHAGIEPQAQWQYSLERLPGAQNYRTLGRDIMRQWLNEGWRDTGCTAIFAQNDLVAVGVMQALQEAGYQIPGDISVIGFDGTEVCDFSQPRLCSVAAPLHEIGVLGSELLVRQIETGEKNATTTKLPARLREGESVGIAQEVTAAAREAAATGRQDGQRTYTSGYASRKSSAII